MEILKNAWINIQDLNEEQQENFKQHYKDNENIYILTTKNNKQYNIEYKILNIKNNIINLQATGKVVI